MRANIVDRCLCASFALLVLPATVILAQQKAPPPTRPPVLASLKTPLAPEVIEQLSNAISGQMPYNNLVKLAGAPWLRTPQELTQTFYEAQAIHAMVQGYGIRTTRLEQHAGSGTYDYPVEGELWLVEPQRRLLARLEADPALIARGSTTADVTGELVYLPPSSREELKKAGEASSSAKFRGKIALLWSHPAENEAKALAAAGIEAVIAFNARERYSDPNEVVYSSGAYGRHEPLKLGLSVSWRQWSELLEDVHLGKKIVVRASARVEKAEERFDVVYSWIPGSEPEARGVVFTAHLFDGFVKRGANDNMSGCVVQLEVLRALSRLIAGGELPRPRRTIHFIWAQEISGTYAFLEHHPGFADRASISINMDMVGEGLRKNNSVLRMSECPGHLPSYLDGLARSIMEYVCRTNDIVFRADVPPGRPGGQYFPIPMVEKNGSLDAFRFSIQPTIGGSDHICFHNPSLAVPAIMLLTWPDQWYHADTDTPDKADPTQLKRAAFIAAACAWAAADCADAVVSPLAEAVTQYGYLRVAQREIPRAMARLDAADSKTLASQTAQALTLTAFGAGRELAALRSIEEIFSGSAAAKTALEAKLRQWEAYQSALRATVLECARCRAAQLNASPPTELPPGPSPSKYAAVVPAIAPSIRGCRFDLERHERYRQYLNEHPDAIKALGISSRQATTILNYVNGKRSMAQICACVAGDLDNDLPLRAVADYLGLLKAVGWVAFESEAPSPGPATSRPQP